MDFDLTQEQKLWKKTVHDFVAKEVQPKAHDVDMNYEFNWEATRKMGPLGLLGLNIPEEYGGAGVDAVSAAIAIEEIGWGWVPPHLPSRLTTAWAQLRSFCSGAKISSRSGSRLLPVERTNSAHWL